MYYTIMHWKFGTTSTPTSQTLILIILCGQTYEELTMLLDELGSCLF